MRKKMLYGTVSILLLLIVLPVVADAENTQPEYTYDTFVFTHSDLLLFSYSDQTDLQVYDHESSLLWNGTLNAGEHKALTKTELISSGTFHIRGTEPSYSVLTGDALSDTMMGYYAKDCEGKGLSTKIYTYQPDTSGAPTDFRNFIVIAYENNTAVQITNSETSDVIWSGELDEGQHHAEPTLSNVYVTVTASKPVSALSYSDQGYYIPASSGTFIGTKFYSWVGGTGSWSGWSLGVHDLNIIAYSDDTDVTVTNTETGAFIWNGTLNAGSVQSISFSNAQYVTITTSKDVNAGFFPYGSKYQNYRYLVQIQDESGKGIGSLFYFPAIAYGNMIIFSFTDNSLVTVTDSAGMEVWSGYLDEGDHTQITPSAKGIYKITGSNPVAVVYYWGIEKGSDFAPLYYSTINSPVINDISPLNIPAESDSFTLTVTGTDFTGESIIRWNDTDKTTTFISETCLDASIPSSDILIPGIANVTVFNPDSGRISNIKTFTITMAQIPPTSVTTLHNTTYLQDSIKWDWTDPSSADFNHVMVYIDGVFQENVTAGIETFTASSLTPETSYTIGTRTVGTTGLVNATWVNHTATTAPGPVTPAPPGSVTNLQNTTYQQTSITWVWTDPADADFDHVMVYLDGVFQENVTAGEETFLASSLTPETSYTIGTRTVGITGLVNATWVNHTATTAPEPVIPVPPGSVTNLHNTTYQQTSITWVWTDPASTDFDHVMVYVDGIFKENVTQGVQFFTATGLNPATEYTIGTRTVGTTGLVNATWVYHTAMTAQQHSGTSFDVELYDGWNIFSTPIVIESGHSKFTEIFPIYEQEKLLIVIGWDGSQWFIPTTETIVQPLDAYFIKVAEGETAHATIIPSNSVSSLPARQIDAGINLIGFAPAYDSETQFFPEMPLNQALVSIEYVGNYTGYTIVVSPSYNQPAWSYAKGGQIYDFIPFKGYWVVMENGPDTLYGFSTTPIQN